MRIYVIRTLNASDGSSVVRSLLLSALIVFAALMVVGMATTTWAVDEPQTPPTSAPKAVREGNLMLKAGDAASALEHYRQAESLKPNAREIAFDRGLGHYALGQFDQAREAFEKAAGGEGDALADDAVYSAGASDHAEGLAKSAEPKLALSKLESAMQRYQSVLSRRPEHEAARDANYKAASTWRTLKQQLEQQQQQNDSQDQNEDGEKQENQEQQPSQQQNKDEQKEQQSAKDKEQESQEQKSEQQQSSSAEEQEKKEEQSKEMQALRDRKKLRPEEVRKVPISPVDKDW